MLGYTVYMKRITLDQLFDRLGNLLKSWVNSDADPFRPEPRPFSDLGRAPSGDPYFDDAMDELDAFLKDDREAQDRLRREAEARAAREESARRPAGSAPGSPSGPPPRLVAAYRTLGLAYGASFEQVRASYKKLLKEHHPDRHGSSPEDLRKATETSARINDAYRMIETWRDKGTLDD